MDYYKIVKLELEKIYAALVDEESRDWFNVRVEWMITRNRNKLLESVIYLAKKYPKKWRHLGMERFIKNREYQGIIIYGCGYEGNLTKEILNLCGYEIAFWCDSNKDNVGKKINNIMVISTEELVKKYDNYLVIIGSTKYKEQIREHLHAYGFSLDQTALFSENAYDWANYGTQYFDMFSPEEEVFVDAGAYNGDTIFDFLKWIKGSKIYKVYSLEPQKDMYEYIKNRLMKNNISKVEVLNYAAWCKEEELSFVNREDGSAIVKGEESLHKVRGMAIDDIVGVEKVSFIKLDIEGSELEALKGASKTIKKYHPKLAISIYHRPEDILQIGRYILKLNPDYRLYIRHYTLTVYETVLYAYS